MTATLVLAVVALAQGVFLALLVGFLLVRRREMRRRRDRFADRQGAAMGALRAWLAGAGDVAAFARSLRGMPRAATLAYTSQLAASVVPAEAREQLADALRDEPWVQHMLAGARKRGWWHRREAARALALVGCAADREQLERLLLDRQPAVAVAAVSALPRAADHTLIGLVLDRYPYHPEVVRHYLRSTLREMRDAVEPVLVTRLVHGAEPEALAHWISLANALELADALERSVSLAVSPHARVRCAVAHALARLPRPQSLAALGVLLADGDPATRAAAARSLGEIGHPSAVQVLTPAMRDPSWAVRYHAALSLAQLGEAGRAVLLGLRGDADRYVADIATLITGLGEGALLEEAVS